MAPTPGCWPGVSVSAQRFTGTGSAPQLAFLVLTLTHLSLQLFCLADKGVRSYWRKPGNWLEVAPRSRPSQI